MSTEQFALTALIVAPLVILGAIGMVRGYHMHLKVWKYSDKEDGNGND